MWRWSICRPYNTLYRIQSERILCRRIKTLISTKYKDILFVILYSIYIQKIKMKRSFYTFVIDLFLYYITRYASRFCYLHEEKKKELLSRNRSEFVIFNKRIKYVFEKESINQAGKIIENRSVLKINFFLSNIHLELFSFDKNQNILVGYN